MRPLPVCRLLLPAVLATAAVLPALPETPEYDMTKYQFVMLVRDAAKPPPAAADEARHRALLAELVARRTAVVEGPVEGADFAELVVLDVPGADEARAALKDDPLVASGVLSPRLLTWFTARGLLQVPPDPAAREDAVLGLLVRPRDAPEYPKEKLEELQAGHMKNMEVMHAAGHLVVAGPFVDGGEMRGVFVFRPAEKARLRELVAKDPAVAAGRLAVRLFPWRVGKGTIPAAPE